MATAGQSEVLVEARPVEEGAWELPLADRALHGAFLGACLVLCLHCLWDIADESFKAWNKRSPVLRLVYTRARSRLAAMGLAWLVSYTASAAGLLSWIAPHMPATGAWDVWEASQACTAGILVLYYAQVVVSVRAQPRALRRDGPGGADDEGLLARASLAYSHALKALRAQPGGLVAVAQPSPTLGEAAAVAGAESMEVLADMPWLELAASAVCAWLAATVPHWSRVSSHTIDDCVLLASLGILAACGLLCAYCHYATPSAAWRMSPAALSQQQAPAGALRRVVGVWVPIEPRLAGFDQRVALELLQLLLVACACVYAYVAWSFQ
eukprot:m51a1_g5947 hypothetical protein (325) ;mRNA; r:128481-130466